MKKPYSTEKKGGNRPISSAKADSKLPSVSYPPSTARGPCTAANTRSHATATLKVPFLSASIAHKLSSGPLRPRPAPPVNTRLHLDIWWPHQKGVRVGVIGVREGVGSGVSTRAVGHLVPERHVQFVPETCSAGSTARRRMRVQYHVAPERYAGPQYLHYALADLFLVAPCAGSVPDTAYGIAFFTG